MIINPMPFYPSKSGFKDFNNICMNLTRMNTVVVFVDQHLVKAYFDSSMISWKIEFEGLNIKYVL